MSAKTFINKLNLVKIRWYNMVNALIKLEPNTNRVLNVIKAKYDLRDKSEAIEFLVGRYIETENDEELKPEFAKKLNKIAKQQSIKVDDFAKRYGIK
jgi:hypothetical protein